MERVLLVLLLAVSLNSFGQIFDKSKKLDKAKEYYQPFRAGLPESYWDFSLGFARARGYKHFASSVKRKDLRGKVFSVGMNVPLKRSKAYDKNGENYLGKKNKFYFAYYQQLYMHIGEMSNLRDLRNPEDVFYKFDFSAVDNNYRVAVPITAELGLTRLMNIGAEFGIKFIKNFNNLVEVDLRYGIQPLNIQSESGSSLGPYLTTGASYGIGVRVQHFRLGLNWYSVGDDIYIIPSDFRDYGYQAFFVSLSYILKN